MLRPDHSTMRCFSAHGVESWLCTTHDVQAGASAGERSEDGYAR